MEMQKKSARKNAKPHLNKAYHEEISLQTMSFELIIESRDVYTYHAIAWFITKHIEQASALASIINAREPAATILCLARGYGHIKERDIWYTCEESAEAYCTDSRPEPWRRVFLKGCSKDHVCDFLRDALKEYRDYIASLKASNGIIMYSWDDSDGWLSSGDAPIRSLESVLLPGTSAEKLLDDLRVFMDPETQKRYSTLNIPLIKVVMLHGIPGSGKTSLVRCIASELGLNVANYSGNDPTMLSDALSQIPTKSLVCVDDIDCMLGSTGNQREKRGFSQLLNALDAVTRKEPLIICLTTNFPGTLDVAIRRRVDHCIEFKHATKQQGTSLIRKFFPDLEDPISLWMALTHDGMRCISMATLQKFLVQSLKYATPWELLKEDPEAFTSLLDIIARDETSVQHMYM